jgi:preprotein translocase subunit SecE
MKKVINFLSEVRLELSKVSWPTPRQTVNLTLVVIIVSLLVGLYVGGLDLLFAKISGAFLK